MIRRRLCIFLHNSDFFLLNRQPDMIAQRNPAREQFLGESVLHRALDQAAQGTRAILGIIARRGQVPDRLLIPGQDDISAAMASISSCVKAWKTIVSSSRFRNSGRNLSLSSRMTVSFMRS